ncbi:MAG: arsenate reductase ArsC [Candidatus Marinimicrobia bacterium]|nr:arsenate reductase ArsC [Candidatus Neomarinimicrobiota bacterium]
MDKKKILFVCTGNSVRSQMAEAILKNKDLDKYEVYSAGSHPASIHKFTRQTLQENGINKIHFTSNSVDEFSDKDLDEVIILCEVAYHYLPEFSTNPKITKWFMDDPINIVGREEKQKQGFQMAFNQIKNRIEEHFEVK